MAAKKSRFASAARGIHSMDRAAVGHPGPTVSPVGADLVRPNPGQALRLAAMLALVVVPFWGVFRGVVVSVAGGSPLAYLLVVPVLTAMIAVGYRTPPRGVDDAESDWILAAVFGGLGLFLRHLMSNRFPTLSGLWHLPLVGAVLWAACLAAVLFGVRRVMQMWALWIFAVVTVTPLPYLLVTAALGGGAIAAAGVTGMVGAGAVMLAGRLSPWRWRLIAAAASSALSVAVGVLVAGAGADRSPQSGLLIALLTGGVIPVAMFSALRSFTTIAEPSRRSSLPVRTPLSMVALSAAAVLVLMLNVPFSPPDAAPVRADANWVTDLNLSAVQQFPFIQRYLGPRATFVRYAVQPVPGLPEAAVDVITADNRAVLHAYRDALWYPATVPPNYRAFELPDAFLVELRTAATDSTMATDADAVDWLVVTWMWQTAGVYQQIFVVVNQTWTSQAPPPEPAALSVRANIIGPALWLIRQQADPGSDVDPLVIARAQQVVRQILSAGMAEHG